MKRGDRAANAFARGLDDLGVLGDLSLGFQVGQAVEAGEVFLGVELGSHPGFLYEPGDGIALGFVGVHMREGSFLCVSIKLTERLSA